ncbi:polyisoprenoid-binding protein YceI/rhodanese-related sulfurtransferase [Desulfobaculum xiamenense]|uniref:Polyisoprenoid-binding protein YceI/rhodanese-related sulfurtransferase n=1 Tax=Desulfobaculum xiamenense TaxID=995050 RepID=A0A846QSF8_9BACT|nr:YceI family protein [Desulfobaculum xiamenense]NJB68375.1 polyisoprenoid-binding protein YceI/rhodanese-related sulfurtransferase [Desulfobaculum xiamenense]
MADAARRIAPGELRQWMDEGREFLCVDVLLPAVHEARRLPGALGACVYEVEFAARMQSLAPDVATTIVLYGEDENTQGADMAAGKLAHLGYGDVWVLAGGARGWVERGLPVEGTGRMPAPEGFVLVEGVYAAVADQCHLEWTGRNARGRHTGTLRVARGRLDVSGGTMRGEVLVALSSLVDTDLADDSLRAMLVAHLLSDDFFFAERYPEARFVLEAAVPVHGATPGQASHDLRGQLELRGVRHPLAVRATLSNLSNGGIGVSAHLEFDRTQWGVAYGSGRFFRHLGHHLVYDMIGVELRLVFGLG